MSALGIKRKMVTFFSKGSGSFLNYTDADHKKKQEQKNMNRSHFAAFGLPKLSEKFMYLN